MIMIDDRGVIELVNVPAERIFGYSREQLLGQTIDMLLPARHREHHTLHREAFFAAPTQRAMGIGQDLFALRSAPAFQLTTNPSASSLTIAWSRMLSNISRFRCSLSVSARSIRQRVEMSTTEAITLEPSGASRAIETTKSSAATSHCSIHPKLSLKESPSARCSSPQGRGASRTGGCARTGRGFWRTSLSTS